MPGCSFTFLLNFESLHCLLSSQFNWPPDCRPLGFLQDMSRIACKTGVFWASERWIFHRVSMISRHLGLGKHWRLGESANERRRERESGRKAREEGGRVGRLITRPQPQPRLKPRPLPCPLSLAPTLHVLLYQGVWPNLTSLWSFFSSFPDLYCNKALYSFGTLSDTIQNTV